MGFHYDARNQILAPLLTFLSLFVKKPKKSRKMEEMLGHACHHSPLDSIVTKISKISNKAVHLKLKGRKDKREKEEDGGFGDGGLWQKAILMGEKCQPPEFSGVIYYDYDGKRLSEPPRSPRAGPLPTNFYCSQCKKRI